MALLCFNRVEMICYRMIVLCRPFRAVLTVKYIGFYNQTAGWHWLGNRLPLANLLHSNYEFVHLCCIAMRASVSQSSGGRKIVRAGRSSLGGPRLWPSPSDPPHHNANPRPGPAKAHTRRTRPIGCVPPTAQCRPTGPAPVPYVEGTDHASSSRPAARSLPSNVC